MMKDTCFICHGPATLEDNLLLVKCKCNKCGSFAYEKNFVTAYEYYVSSFSSDNALKIKKQMQKEIKKGNICFVDDYETSIVKGYTLLEFIDILNKVGLDLAHTNTIDSNWKD